MKIFPARDNIQRTEQELRLQPFTLLATVPVVLTVAAGLIYTCVYSDDEGEVIRHGLLALLIAAPTIVLFTVVWKKEARRPFSLSARRVAWRAMFYGYLAAIVGVVSLAIIFRASGSKLSRVIVFCIVGIPIGHILYRLAATNEKRG